jgi:AraC-like DNA-binding protein
MKNYCIPFGKFDNEERFNKFATDLDGLVENKDTIILSGKTGSGHVRKIFLEPGLSMRVWNVVFHQATDICKEATETEEQQASYNVIYILTPDSLFLKKVGQHQQFNRPRVKSTLLASDSISIDLQVDANCPVHLIDFIITAEWLRQHLGSKATPAEESNARPYTLPSILIDPCSSAINSAAAKLFDLSILAVPDATQLQSLSSVLVNDFVRKSLYGEVRNTRSNKEFYHKKIMEAEAILQAHLQKNLPRLDNIAQQVALSESTLKRYFKVIFGKSVYEYYLEKKMDHAKTLLLGKPITVNEAAELLGYEKVSNFIDIFKKHHGYSPGSMKKRFANASAPVELVQ